MSNQIIFIGKKEKPFPEVYPSAAENLFLIRELRQHRRNQHVNNGPAITTITNCPIQEVPVPVQCIGIHDIQYFSSLPLFIKLCIGMPPTVQNEQVSSRK